MIQTLFCASYIHRRNQHYKTTSILTASIIALQRVSNSVLSSIYRFTLNLITKITFFSHFGKLLSWASSSSSLTASPSFFCCSLNHSSADHMPFPRSTVLMGLAKLHFITFPNNSAPSMFSMAAAQSSSNSNSTNPNPRPLSVHVVI